MRTLVLAMSIVSVLATAQLFAQQPPDGRGAAATTSVDGLPGTVQATPQMWFYVQEMRRYDDPKTAVRRKAEFRAAQRRNRLAALKWFGYSNARPQANPTPWTYVYSPTWIGNTGNPYNWAGGMGTAFAVYESRSIRR